MFYFTFKLKHFYVIIIIYFICYSYSCKHCSNDFHITLDYFNKHFSLQHTQHAQSFKCIVYNLQRLPYLLRDIKIDNIIHKYDICILQEFFNDLFFKRNRYLNKTNKFFNSGGKNMFSSKLINSGLVTTSAFFLEFVDFIEFKKYKHVDTFANKGFLVSRINLFVDSKQAHSLFIINTHLQNFYTFNEYKCNIISKQLKMIDTYIDTYISNFIFNNDFSLIVAGDFNRNLTDINWSIPPNQIICSDIPTVWDNRDGIVPISTPKQIDTTQKPYWTDGAFLWSKTFKAVDIKNVILDKYTDHCGIDFTLTVI